MLNFKLQEQAAWIFFEVAMNPLVWDKQIFRYTMLFLPIVQSQTIQRIEIKVLCKTYDKISRE